MVYKCRRCGQPKKGHTCAVPPGMASTLHKEIFGGGESDDDEEAQPKVVVLDDSEEEDVNVLSAMKKRKIATAAVSGGPKASGGANLPPPSASPKLLPTSPFLAPMTVTQLAAQVNVTSTVTSLPAASARPIVSTQPTMQPPALGSASPAFVAMQQLLGQVTTLEDSLNAKGGREQELLSQLAQSEQARKAVESAALQTKTTLEGRLATAVQAEGDAKAEAALAKKQAEVAEGAFKIAKAETKAAEAKAAEAATAARLGKGKGKAKAKAGVSATGYEILIDHCLTKTNEQEAKITAEHAQLLHATTGKPAPLHWSFSFDDDNGQKVALADATVVSELTALVMQKSAPQVTYSYGQNTYECILAPAGEIDATMQAALTLCVGSIALKQTNTSHQAHKVRFIHAMQTTTAPPPSVPDYPRDLLYGKPYIPLTNALIKRVEDAIDANEHECAVASTHLAALGACFSKHASGLSFNATRCKLHCHPPFLATWLRVAKERGMKFIRVVGHGSGNYDGLRKDPTGADVSLCNPGCAKGYAFYVSVSDHIPRDYNNGMPDGTFMLGLLLCKDDKEHSYGAYERYKLRASTMPPDLQADSTVLDAIAIRDQVLYLPLGVLQT